MLVNARHSFWFFLSFTFAILRIKWTKWPPPLLLLAMTNYWQCQIKFAFFCFLLFFLFRSLIKWQTQAVYHFIRWWRAKWVQQQQQRDFSVSKKEKRMEKIKSFFTATQEWRRLQQQQQQPSVPLEKSSTKKIGEKFWSSLYLKDRFSFSFCWPLLLCLLRDNYSPKHC